MNLIWPVFLFILMRMISFFSCEDGHQSSPSIYSCPLCQNVTAYCGPSSRIERDIFFLLVVCCIYLFYFFLLKCCKCVLGGAHQIRLFIKLCVSQSKCCCPVRLIPACSLLRQMALLRTLVSDTEENRMLLTAVTAVRVGRELHNRLTCQDKIDAYKVDRLQCIGGAVECDLFHVASDLFFAWVSV